MKKTILTMILVLAVVYAVLAVLCSDPEYSAERFYYEAMKITSKIAANPDVVPPKMVDAVEKKLMRILKEYSGTTVAKAARMKLAEFYLASKKYDKALDAVDVIMRTETNNRLVMSTAQFIKGMVYERQGMWDKALVQFTYVRDAYKDTPIGLQIPLYIAMRKAQDGNDEEAKVAYNVAVYFYEGLEKDNRTKELGYAAASYLVRTYMILKEYEKAGRVVEDIIENYPVEPLIAQQLSNADLVYTQALKRPEKTIEVFTNAKIKLKNKRLIGQVDKRIKELESRKK